MPLETFPPSYSKGLWSQIIPWITESPGGWLIPPKVDQRLQRRTDAFRGRPMTPEADQRLVECPRASGFDGVEHEAECVNRVELVPQDLNTLKMYSPQPAKVYIERHTRKMSCLCPIDIITGQHEAGYMPQEWGADMRLKERVWNDRLHG